MTHPIRYMTEAEVMNYFIAMAKENQINNLAREGVDVEEIVTDKINYNKTRL